MNQTTNFLLSTEGKTYLSEEYVAKERSTHEIAKERKTYPNCVRRALLFHGIPLRSKAQAQTAALKHGRHPHPTKGQIRSEQTRQKISEGLRKLANAIAKETSDVQ